MAVPAVHVIAAPGATARHAAAVERAKARNIDRSNIPDELPPASAVLSKYGRDILALPGVLFTGWTIAKPNSLHVVFEAPEFNDMARAIMRSKIDDISIDLETYTPKPDRSQGAAGRDARTGAASVAKPASVPWQYNLPNMTRAIDAVPGIWGHEYGREDIVFNAVNRETAERVSNIFNTTFGGHTIHFAGVKPPIDD